MEGEEEGERQGERERGRAGPRGRMGSRFVPTQDSTDTPAERTYTTLSEMYRSLHQTDVAMYDFTPTHRRCASLIRGEEVIVIETKPDWTTVLRKNGQQGAIPILPLLCFTTDSCTVSNTPLSPLTIFTSVLFCSSFIYISSLPSIARLSPFIFLFPFFFIPLFILFAFISLHSPLSSLTIDCSDGLIQWQCFCRVQLEMSFSF